MSEQKPRRRGPKAKAQSYRRIELYWPDDAMLAELREEAHKRGVSLQAHMRDLLVARHLARQGESLARLLWVPEPEPPISDGAPVPLEGNDAEERAAEAFKAALLAPDDDE
jgi:hypothetical protein